MTRFISFIFVAALATACHPEPVVADRNEGDSNGDGIKDAEQSIGTGVDPTGEPMVIFFAGAHMPPFRGNMQWIGFGCSAFDGDASDDWLHSCAPLSPYIVGDVVWGYALTGIPEGVPFEGVPVDANSFTPGGGGWTNAANGQTAKDERDFFVRHVDWTSCPIEDQENATHYGFIRVDDVIQPLTGSIAPPNEDCSN